MAWFLKIKKFWRFHSSGPSIPIPASTVSVASEFCKQHVDLIVHLEIRGQDAEPILFTDIDVAAEVLALFHHKLAEADAQEQELLLEERNLLEQLKIAPPTESELEPPEQQLWHLLIQAIYKPKKRGPTNGK